MNPNRAIAAVAILTCSAFNSGAELQNVDLGQYQVFIQSDYTQQFDIRNVANSSSASVSGQEKSDGVVLPGIFLHPQGQGDAVLRFPSESIGAVPASNGNDKTWSDRNFSYWLLFRIGLRDGIPWEDPANPANGVRFSVTIDGQTAFTEDCTGPGWRARAIDLSPWAGRTVPIEFRTNAIDGNTAYDWGVFARPLLVRVRGTSDLTQIRDRDYTGIVLAKVVCDEPSVVSFTMGDSTQKETLTPGVRWIPFDFLHVGDLAFHVDSGKARLEEAIAAPHDSFLCRTFFEPSSPLLIAEEPFNLIVTTTNPGYGRVFRNDLTLAVKPPREGASLGSAAHEQKRTSTLEPGASETLVYENLVADAPGDWTINGQSYHVFPPEPQWPETLGRHAAASVVEESPVRAVLETNAARLVFVTDDSGEAYAAAFVASDIGWRRVASLYPLAQGSGRIGQNTGFNGVFRATSFDIDKGHRSLIVDGRLEGGAGESLSVRLTYSSYPQNGSIDIQVEAKAPADIQLASLTGPVVLAGDHAYGTNKDFAIFPGLEYLEAGEPSSSTRDLAYPLSDRRVPAIHKLAAPLMAVQGQESLVALLWDANQEWAPGLRHPAARFVAAAPEVGFSHVHLSLFAPSVGEYVKENQTRAIKPYPWKSGETIALRSTLVLEHASRYPKDSIVHGPHKGGLVLQAMRHYFDVFGLPEPSPLPRPWDDERALCRDAYHRAVWSEDPAGWAHCQGWKPTLAPSHAVPLLLDMQAGLPDDVRAESQRRIDAVWARTVKEDGPQGFWNNAACHILLGELPFYSGYLTESLADMGRQARAMLERRENGLWVWHPAEAKFASLGKDGDHTLGQAAQPAFFILRAARLSGDQELARLGLEAMKQMEQYEVPRGAQTWECPLYQPDILAAAHAIRAYTEAYRLTGDPAHLDHARYWAWTGLPFLYTWQMDGYPTMPYNVISVFGSTFYTHSWIGLPVVWCGLVYAYALQDLAEFDDSFPWKTVAEGITNSAMWQQYPDGIAKGCYPDSWDMVRNGPNPANINPENILVNGFRLRGLSPEPRFARIETPDGYAALNTLANITRIEGSVKSGKLTLGLDSPDAYTLLAPVPEPKSVTLDRAPDEAALRAQPGWTYDPSRQSLLLRTQTSQPVTIQW